MARLILLLIVFLSSTQAFRPSNSDADFAPVVVAPPRSLLYLNFGFQRIIADSLWLRWLQDVDLCRLSGEFGANREEKNRRVIDPKLNYGKCEKGWSFEILDRITDLDPSFKLAFSFGSLMLSVIVKDIQGATILLEKGMIRYPNNWPMFQKAAYHFMFEDKKPEKAVAALKGVVKNGGPVWYANLAAQIESQSGRELFALDYLLGVKSEFKDSDSIPAIEQKIKQIKEKISQKKTQ